MALTIEGKRCDPLIQGTAMLDQLPRARANALLDEVTAAGATSFDLANNYGAGEGERIFGDWAKRHGEAERFFLVTKGGHPEGGRARVNATDARSDLEQSLVSLGVPCIDLYLLHRDDASVPVGEVVDFLDGFLREGLIRAYGGSNWSVERIEAARSYASANGRAGFAASSPNFSLATPRIEPWPGCVSVSGQQGEASRAYYERVGMPVLAWSSLAMGFFALEDAATDASDTTQAKSFAEDVFGTPDNEARRARARALAAEFGCSATEVAFRYVRSQPFEVIPIAGCLSGEEYEALRRAADDPLAPDVVRWLETGAR